MFAPHQLTARCRQFITEDVATSATEYAVMLGLIAIAAIAAAGGIGRSMQGIYDQIEAEVDSAAT